MGWREVLVLSQRPSCEVALAASRMRFLSRFSHPPAAFIGLFCRLVVLSGVGRWLMTFCDMRCVLKPLLDQLPLPTVDPNSWQ